MKCLRCGKNITGSVCECGFQLDDDSITTVFPLNEDALMQIYYRENGFIIKDGRLIKYCGDTQVQELHIPNGVTIIGPGSGLKDLECVKKVFIPASFKGFVWRSRKILNEIGAEIVVDKGNKHYYSKNGVLFEYGVQCFSWVDSPDDDIIQNINSGDTLLVYPFKKDDYQYCVPDNISCIADDAFFCARVQRIILPNSIRIIAENAFHYCSELLNLKIPDSVAWMGLDWISTCYLRSLSMPYINHDLTPIPHVEVDNFILRISDSRTEIEENEFAWIKNGRKNYMPGKKISIILPDTVTVIQNKAFHTIPNLVSIKLSKNLKFIGKEAFANCINLFKLSLPDKLQIIEKGAFVGCLSLKEVTLPPSIGFVGSCAFGPGLEILKISTKNLELIDIDSFCLCSKLTESHIIAPPETRRRILHNRITEEAIDLFINSIRSNIQRIEEHESKLISYLNQNQEDWD